MKDLYIALLSFLLMMEALENEYNVIAVMWGITFALWLFNGLSSLWSKS